MDFAPSALPVPRELPRCGVVDLGSNSVRLVVYEGHSRNPMPIFNEKAVLRLGRGLDATGRLNEDGVAQALTVMHRYHAVARAMGADPFEVLATAAVRDAENGRAFIEALQQRMPDVPIHILSGMEEAAFSADGMLCGIPSADGMLADIGGGSLELVRLERGTRGPAQTLRLGVIRLADRSGGDPVRARALAEADLQTVPWLGDAAGSDLYLVGGAFRALARIHMAQTGYPLAMVHHYTIGREEARDLAGLISTAPRKVLERLPSAPRRRIDDLPFAAVVLRRLLRLSNARRVVFSASGLREGWFMRRMPPEIRLQDPLMAAARDLAARFGRDPSLPPALLQWTAPLFPHEGAGLAPAARGGVLDVGYRQPRPPGVPCRAGIPPRAAAAGHRAGPSCAGVPRPGHGPALRGRHRRGLPGPGEDAARPGRAGAGRGARGRAAAGLHAVGRHAGPAGRHAAADPGRRVDAAAAGEQRRVRRRERDPPPRHGWRR